MKPWRDGPQVTGSLYSHIVTHRNLQIDDSFLVPKWPEDLHNPFDLADMEKAVTRIWQAIEKKENIGIAGDYDMDGTPASALLGQFLERVGIKPVIILPTREEGYGFSSHFVDRFAHSAVSLIVTVDCGIRDAASVAYAQEKDIDVIITDHHECAETLPPAFAVINPKRPDSSYPFRELCGTAVAYKLVTALIGKAPASYKDSIPEAWLAWSLDLVAMATIGDMMPLVDENRVFVTYGLKVLRKTARLGLQRFFESAGIDAGSLTYTDISFKIIPKFNASGRMENMDDVLTLLMTTSVVEADAAVKRVLARGAQSQLLLSTMLEQARAQTAYYNDAPVVLLADDGWHPGLTGLVAGRLTEELKRPVGVFAGVEGSHYRGSMRSIPGIHLPRMLEEASDLLDKYGGHEQAAGLSFPKTNLDKLRIQLATASPTHREPISFETDGTIQPGHVTLPVLDELGRLSPWGMGHSEPLWSLRNVELRDVNWLSDGQHCRAVIHGEDGAVLPVIYFRAESLKPIVNSRLDIYGTLDVNEFRGKRTPQFMIKGAVLTHG